MAVILQAFPGVLGSYDQITLARMNGVELLKRTDTKYVLSTAQAIGTLESLSRDYWVLEVAGTRLQHYRTQYFDTATLAMYLSHHAGNAVRYKVRNRTYLDSGVSFFEVKRKNNKDWTTKYRTPIVGCPRDLTPEARLLLKDHLPLPAQSLEPTLRNDFVRITLVSKRYAERVTIDLGLLFARGATKIVLPRAVIAEVKQAGINRGSDFIRAVRQRGLHPTGISKYCIGVSLLYDSVKHNNFKPKLRLIEKVAGVWEDGGNLDDRHGS